MLVYSTGVIYDRHLRSSKYVYNTGHRKWNSHSYDPQAPPLDLRQFQCGWAPLSSGPTQEHQLHRILDIHLTWIHDHRSFHYISYWTMLLEEVLPDPISWTSACILCTLSTYGSNDLNCEQGNNFPELKNDEDIFTYSIFLLSVSQTSKQWDIYIYDNDFRIV
jgi:hypothetical protein